MESMDKILHSTIKRWGSVAAVEVYVDPHPTQPCHLRCCPLKPFPQNLHSISRKWFGRISPDVSNACERVNRDFLYVSLHFQMKAVTFSPWLQRVQAGICESKKLYLLLRPVRSSPPLGFCQRQYFPFAAPGHTAVRRFMLHFSMGEDNSLIYLNINNYNERSDVRAKVVF